MIINWDSISAIASIFSLVIAFISLLLYIKVEKERIRPAHKLTPDNCSVSPPKIKSNFRIGRKIIIFYISLLPIMFIGVKCITYLERVNINIAVILSNILALGFIGLCIGLLLVYVYDVIVSHKIQFVIYMVIISSIAGIIFGVLWLLVGHYLTPHIFFFNKLSRITQSIIWSSVLLSFAVLIYPIIPKRNRAS